MELGGDESPLAEAILDRIKHDAYKINIVPSNAAQYRSMREVYGMDRTESVKPFSILATIRSDD